MLHIALIIIVLTVIYFKLKFSFWKHAGIPYSEPTIPFGNLKLLFTKEPRSMSVQVLKLYNEFKAKGIPFFGYYLLTKPILVVIDTELIKHILVKDYAYFTDRPYYVNDEVQPLDGNLFFLCAPKWRSIRQNFTPAFTSGKMKMMFSILLDCTIGLSELLNDLVSNNKPLDIKETAARFTIDVIGAVAIGIECNAIKDPENEFRKYGKKIFQENFYRMMKIVVIIMKEELAKFLKIDHLDRDTSNFFQRVFKETILYRLENKVHRNDFMQMMINVHKTGNVEGIEDEKTMDNKISLEDVIAQAFMFFTAGFETTSSTMTYCLFELAQNPEIQVKLREEIHTILGTYNGKITYAAIEEMTYMKQIIDETLRKYPVVQSLDRKCVKDYPIPNSEAVLKNGTAVYIPLTGLHLDSENFPDPKKFDPDRFSEENIKTIKPSTYLPFGDGPRICIGRRFGIMQTKVGLITLLKNFKYTLNAATDPDVKFSSNLISTAASDILLDITRI